MGVHRRRDVRRAREEEDGAPMAASQRRSNPRRHLQTGRRRCCSPRAVQYEFAGKPGKNQDFIAVMRGFSLGFFGVDGVVSYLQPLFQGYPDLIRKFNTFLPSGYELRDNQVGGADA